MIHFMMLATDSGIRMIRVGQGRERSSCADIGIAFSDLPLGTYIYT